MPGNFQDYIESKFVLDHSILPYLKDCPKDFSDYVTMSLVNLQRLARMHQAQNIGETRASMRAVKFLY